MSPNFFYSQTLFVSTNFVLPTQMFGFAKQNPLQLKLVLLFFIMFSNGVVIVCCLLFYFATQDSNASGVEGGEDFEVFEEVQGQTSQPRKAIY
jgi:hypothetical protein